MFPCLLTQHSFTFSFDGVPYVFHNEILTRVTNVTIVMCVYLFSCQLFLICLLLVLKSLRITQQTSFEINNNMSFFMALWRIVNLFTSLFTLLFICLLNQLGWHTIRLPWWGSYSDHQCHRCLSRDLPPACRHVHDGWVKRTWCGVMVC